MATLDKCSNFSGGERSLDMIEVKIVHSKSLVYKQVLCKMVIQNQKHLSF